MLSYIIFCPKCKKPTYSMDMDAFLIESLLPEYFTPVDEKIESPKIGDRFTCPSCKFDLYDHLMDLYTLYKEGKLKGAIGINKGKK